MESYKILLIGCAIFFVLVLVAFIFLAMRYKKCPPDKIMVISGKVGNNPDGTPRTSICRHGGAVFIWPLVQTYSFLDLTPISISVDLKSALNSQNIPINITGRFTVGISTEPNLMQNAAEQLLGMPLSNIYAVAESIVLGQLRFVVSETEIELIYADRDKFLTNMAQLVENELKKIGMCLINLKIIEITDENGCMKELANQAATKVIEDAKPKQSDPIAPTYKIKKT